MVTAIHAMGSAIYHRAVIPNGNPASSGRSLRAAIGLGTSVTAVAIVATRTDLASTLTTMQRAIPLFVGATLLATCADLAFRTQRWQQLLPPLNAVSALHALPLATASRSG